MKANIKGIELEGTPQEILLFISLMDWKKVSSSTQSMSKNVTNARFKNEYDLVEHTTPKSVNLMNTQEAARKYYKGSFQ